MTAPTTTVEIAFTSDYSTPEGSRVWTDVTAYVEAQEGLPIQFGRTDERSSADANSVTVTLDNRDGRFTPEKTTGAYYPNVKLYRPIRVTAQYSGGASVRRFTGYVRSWTPSWTGGSEAIPTVVVQASSRMQRMALADELRSPVKETILAASASRYWPLDDESDAPVASSLAPSVAPLTIVGSGAEVVFGSATGAPKDGATSASFAAGKYLTLGDTTMPLSGGAFYASGCVGAFVRVTAAGGNIFSLGDVTLAASGALTAGTVSLSAPTVADGSTHWVGVELVINTVGPTYSAKLYVDGALADSTSGVGVPWNGVGVLNVGSGMTGAVGHFAMFATGTIPESEIYSAGFTGFAGETTSARLDRLASWRGIPAAEVDAINTTRTVQHWDTSDGALLDAMRVLESTESGVLNDGRDGHLRLIGEAGRFTASSAFTLDLAEQYVNADFEPNYDDTQLLNDATCVSKDGSSARATDVASVSALGRAAEELVTASTDSGATADDAAWAVARYAIPATRLGSVTVAVHSLTDAVLREAIMAADIGTLLTISSLPSQFSASSGSWFIEGYSEDFAVGTHYITLNLSSSTAYLSTLVLDSGSRGVLDTNTLGH